MARKQTSVAAAAAGSAAVLNLASNAVLPIGVDLGADLALAGETFAVYGAIDSSTVAGSPNKVAIANWTVSSGTSTSGPNVDGWPVLVLVRSVAGDAGNLYAGGELTSLDVPVTVALPAVGAFLANPLAMVGGSQVLMLDKAATASDSVDVYTGEDPNATAVAIGASSSPPGYKYAGRLYGGGGYLRINASYIQVKPVAKPAATAIFAAGTTDAGSLPVPVSVTAVASTIVQRTAAGAVMAVALLLGAVGSVISPSGDIRIPRAARTVLAGVLVDGTTANPLLTTDGADGVSLVGAGTINVGTNAVDHATNIGSTTGGSLTTLQGGTTGISIQATGAGPIHINDGAGTGNTSIGNNTGRVTITCASTSALACVAGTVLSIGTDGNDHTVNMGSVTGVSRTTINGGTDGVRVNGTDGGGSNGPIILTAGTAATSGFFVGAAGTVTIGSVGSACSVNIGGTGGIKTISIGAEAVFVNSISIAGSASTLGFFGAAPVVRPAAYTLNAGSTTRNLVDTSFAGFAGQDNAQPGSVYAKFADLTTLTTQVTANENVLRQLLTDLQAFGLLQ